MGLDCLAGVMNSERQDLSYAYSGLLPPRSGSYSTVSGLDKVVILLEMALVRDVVVVAVVNSAIVAAVYKGGFRHISRA